MKLAQDMLRTYEYHQQVELVRPAVKYDNRAWAASSLQFWAAAHNTREKVSAAEIEAPSNETAELLAEGYVAAFERQSSVGRGGGVEA